MVVELFVEKNFSLAGPVRKQLYHLPAAALV